MKKNKKLGCLSLLLLSPCTMAMQPIDDQSLATMTGQDGLTIQAQANVEFKQLSMIDNDGLSYGSGSALYTSPDYTKRAGLVIAGQTSSSPIRIVGLNGSTETILGLQAVIDSDAGTVANKGAFTNIALSFNNNITGIRISPFSVYTASENTLSDIVNNVYTKGTIFDSATLKPKSGLVKELLRVGGASGIDIAFAANKPTMNIQLGAASQGHMVMFGGAINSICGSGSGCNIVAVSDYDGSNNPYGIGFDFQFTGYNNSPFGLTGFYAGIEGKNGTDSGGLVFGNVGTSDKFNLSLNNLMIGQAGSSSTVYPSATFNGLPNASIGSMGAIGTSVTNLKMKVSGM